MNIDKEISHIKKILVDMDNCKSADKFYELCTSLYFNLNCLVFNFEHYKFKVDEVKDDKLINDNFNKFLSLGDSQNVSDNRADFN